MRFFFTFLLLAVYGYLPVRAQVKKNDYLIELSNYQKNYINTHEVVTGKNRKHFRFFPVNELYKIDCNFEKINDTTQIIMKTSAGGEKYFLKYGKINFVIRDTTVHLFIYQSKGLIRDEKYKEYLFLPFTDKTTGNESYGSGRYIDFLITDIVDNKITVDFNKSYNPYCAYTSGYKCPIPPKENHLPVEIKAGEKTFGKHHD